MTARLVETRRARLAVALLLAGCASACGTRVRGYCATTYGATARSGDQVVIDWVDVNAARTQRDRCACAHEDRPLSAVGVCGGVSPRMDEIWSCFTTQGQRQTTRVAVEYTVDGHGDVEPGSVQVRPGADGVEVAPPFAECLRGIFATTHYCVNALDSGATRVVYRLGFQSQEGS